MKHLEVEDKIEVGSYFEVNLVSYTGMGSVGNKVGLVSALVSWPIALFYVISVELGLNPFSPFIC